MVPRLSRIQRPILLLQTNLSILFSSKGSPTCRHGRRSAVHDGTTRLSQLLQDELRAGDQLRTDPRQRQGGESAGIVLGENRTVLAFHGTERRLAYVHRLAPRHVPRGNRGRCLPLASGAMHRLRPLQHRSTARGAHHRSTAAGREGQPRQAVVRDGRRVGTGPARLRVSPPDAGQDGAQPVGSDQGARAKVGDARRGGREGERRVGEREERRGGEVDGSGGVRGADRQGSDEEGEEAREERVFGGGQQRRRGDGEDRACVGRPGSRDGHGILGVGDTSRSGCAWRAPAHAEWKRSGCQGQTRGVVVARALHGTIERNDVRGEGQVDPQTGVRYEEEGTVRGEHCQEEKDGRGR
mmetsp:Transcript_363/g.702  ORF Transcript_363/g.702 Transcript_363/m.702 type:complete len:354 (-) Transcript_363:88-1149(-)